MNGVEVRNKRPRGVQVSPLSPLSLSSCAAPPHSRS
jgi:hypothetical protein